MNPCLHNDIDDRPEGTEHRRDLISEEEEHRVEERWMFIMNSNTVIPDKASDSSAVKDQGQSYPQHSSADNITWIVQPKVDPWKTNDN